MQRILKKSCSHHVLQRLLFVGLAFALFPQANTRADELAWDANGATTGQSDGSGQWLGTQKWWDGSNNVDWSTGDTASFGHGGTGNSVTLASPTMVASLNFHAFSGTYTLGTSGQSLTINDGMVKNADSGAVSFVGPILLGGSQTWTNNSSTTLTTGRAANLIDNNGHQLTLDGTGTITFGVINNSDPTLTGSGALVKSGSGRLNVGGLNSGFTGTVTINGGVLQGYNHANVLGSGNLTLNGGVLSFYWGTSYNRTLGTGTNQVQLPGGESGFAGSGTSAPSINLGGSVIWGASGEGSATGFFNPSKLVLGDAGTHNAAVVNFTSGIDLNGTSRSIYVPYGTSASGNVATISGSISNSTGSAGLIKEGAGTLILSSANTYNGGTAIGEGTLQINHLASLGSTTATLTVNGGLLNLNNMNGLTVGNLTGTGGTIANNGANDRSLTIGAGDGSGGSFAGVIANTTAAHAGELALIKTGSGTITLAGDNTYTGVTTIDGGTLQIGDGGSTGSLATTEAVNNATLIYDRSDAFSIGYPVTGSGELIKQGAGTMTFSAPPVYSGHTTISEGVLRLNQANSSNDPAFITIAESGATLDLNFSGTDEVGELYIGASRMPSGVYKAIGSPESGTAIAQITGTGTLTVTGDVNPPTLVSIDDDNDSYAAPTGTPILYTFTFSEDIDSDSVSAEDFENAGTAEIGIGAITETSPGVFTVLITPSSAGTLQVQIAAGANLTDPSGNPMDTTSAMADDSSLPVYVSDAGAPQLVGISPVATNVGSTITLTMPAEAKPGDLLVANIAHYASGQYGAVFNSGTGWLSLKTGRLSNQDNTRLGIYYRVVSEADSGTFPINLGYDAPYAATGVVMAFSGVDMAYGPLDVSASSIYSETSPSATAGPVAAISTVSPNSLLLMLGMAIGDQPVSWSDWATTSPDSLTELYDLNGTGGIKDISLGAAWTEKAATGTTGTGSANLSASVHNGSVLLALRPAYNSALVSALTALKAHITGEAPLSAGQIATHLQTIVNNRLSYGTSPSALAAAFDLVRTYDDVLGPLWVAQTLPARSQLVDDIHYTIFTVMQHLVDYGYTPANLAKHPELFDGFLFGSSANFPGPCPPPADPEAIHTTLIDADYPDSWGRTVFMESALNPSPKPTGTYLAPGSVATVTVPPALVGAGYQIRVGAHNANFEDKTAVKRLNRCTVVYPIDATSTQVANPLGGGIYIEVPPYRTNVGVVSVEIKNAVRSPYFSAKSFHQTTLAEWQNVERHHPAPWADFQSDKVMMQVPTSWIYALEDPVTLMADWDRAADACNDLMGFPRDRGRETIYNQVDLLLKNVAYTPGYPAVNNTYQPGTNYNGYANNYLVRGPQYAPDFEFHELGHAYQFPKFPGETESDVNLLHVPVMQAFGADIDEAFRSSRNGPAYATLDTTAIAWMMCDNFLDGLIMQGAEKQYALKGHAKFVEIARLFGWERLSNYFLSFNEDYENSVPIATDVDSLLLRLSHRVGIDVRPLFHFWGVPPLDSAIQAASLPGSGMIYDTLVRYKSLIPADNAQFRTFALGWWGREPLDTGFSEERNHASRWADYDPAMAAATTDRAQTILDLYFPDGRPSDYGDWRSQWADADLLDPQEDLDGDGMSNEEERIWGLHPSRASSRSPILGSADLPAGTLSYSRRSPALTGLNYSVWTSTDLVEWEEDTGAQQSPGEPDAFGVETVAISLTPERLDHPSLFIQIRAGEP